MGRLRSEDYILSIIPRGTTSSRVIHIGCADGSLTARLPGSNIVATDPDKAKIALAVERWSVERHIRFVACDVSDVGAIDDAPFDLAVITGAFNEGVIGKTFPLAWAAVRSVLRVGSLVVHDHEDEKFRYALPIQRLDRLLYEGPGGLHVLELCKL